MRPVQRMTGPDTPMRISISEVTIGDLDIGGMEFDVHDVYVLTEAGLDDDTGLLGMDFLGRFAAVQIYLHSQAVRFDIE